ncbi:hypothetical protein [Synechocystis sp. PCC 6714]|uniref:hypothetical protein n=1 Tax=Synechocystis sp. (strain PCC 6714) TaxID=1147 RepID=UPI0004920A5E|nr:hypothetical protein [Synechocystis sp. PCC 6714]
MMQFQILANDYLNINVNSFYHVNYTRMGNPGNPDYLNVLKNTFNDFSERKLSSAVQELRSVLQEDLPQIPELLGFDAITVCVVPRAKAEDNYHIKQRLFKITVQEVVRQVDGLVDGTDFIRRNVNTMTTHLRNPIPNYINDGPLPYPGITRETCEISPNVEGRNILLIDDIYTPRVNIDEDVINALIEMGTNTVIFYAVARVL